MIRATYFEGGKTDVFPAREEAWPDIRATLTEHADQAPGLEKGAAGFVIFCVLKPGTDITVATLNLQRAKEDKRALSYSEERCVRAHGYRNYAHVAEVTAFGIDYDEHPEETPNWDPAVWPCDVYAHSTHNYDPQTRPGKWRVILPLAVPLPIEKELAVRKVLQQYLPRGAILRAPHQPAFLPTCPAGGRVEVVHVKQTDVPAALDWRLLPDLDAAPTVHAEGEAGGTLLGAEFDKRGLVHRDLGTKLDVVCPWAAEHKSGGDLAYLYFSADGLGKFGCAHGACKGRDSTDVFELWWPGDGLPGVSSASPAPSRAEDTGAVASPGPGPLVNATVPAPVWLTGAALAEPVPDVAWLVPALELAPGRPPLLSADSGAGKSWATQSIAISVAAGVPVFGEFPCRQGAVFHIAEDSDVYAVLDRYQRLARGLGVDLEALPLAVYARPFRVVDPKGEFLPKTIAGVLDTATRQGGVLVIVDSLASVCVGLEENSPEIAQPLYASRHPSVTVLWTHHTGKEGGVYRGSSAIRAAAGAMWEMSGSDDEPRVWRNTKHAERTASRGRLNTFSTTWEPDSGRIVLVDEAGRRDNPTQRIRRDILRHLHRKGAAAASHLCAVITGKTDAIKSTLKAMAQEGLLSYDGRRYLISVGVDAEKLLRDE